MKKMFYTSGSLAAEEAQLREAAPPTGVFGLRKPVWPREVTVSHKTSTCGVSFPSSFIYCFHHCVPVLSKAWKNELHIMKYITLTFLKFLPASTGGRVQGNPLYQDCFIPYSRFSCGPWSVHIWLCSRSCLLL